MEQTSARRKLDRAIVHLTRLCEETEAFAKSNAYVFRTDPERRTPQRVDYRCYAIEKQPPDPGWSLLAGDAIQNLRAALDHVVWAATPEAKQNTQTAFPIVTDPGKFAAEQARRCPDVPPTMRETIAREQPFERWPKDPREDELAILQRLSNLDKHRTLATIVSAIDFEGVGTTHPHEVAWTEHASGKSLGSDETYVSSFTATTTASYLDEAEVETRFSYEVVIEDRDVATLIWIAKRVYQLIVECETGVPVHPFAQYPI